MATSPPAPVSPRAPHAVSMVEATLRFSNGGRDPAVPDYAREGRGMARVLPVRRLANRHRGAQPAVLLRAHAGGLPRVHPRGDRRPSARRRRSNAPVGPPRGRPGDPGRALRRSAGELPPAPTTRSMRFAGRTRTVTTASCAIARAGAGGAGDLDRGGQERGRDYLVRDIVERAGAAFRLLVVVAADGDPVDDPTVEWPADRERVEVGRLVLTGRETERERDGDISSSRPRMVDGIECSDDPILHFRPEPGSRSRAGPPPEGSTLEAQVDRRRTTASSIAGPPPGRRARGTGLAPARPRAAGGVAGGHGGGRQPERNRQHRADELECGEGLLLALDVEAVDEGRAGPHRRENQRVLVQEGRPRARDRSSLDQRARDPRCRCPARSRRRGPRSGARRAHDLAQERRLPSLAAEPASIIERLLVRGRRRLDHLVASLGEDLLAARASRSPARCFRRAARPPRPPAGTGGRRRARADGQRPRIARGAARRRPRAPNPDEGRRAITPLDVSWSASVPSSGGNARACMPSRLSV